MTSRSYRNPRFSSLVIYHLSLETISYLFRLSIDYNLKSLLNNGNGSYFHFTFFPKMLKNKKKRGRKEKYNHLNSKRSEVKNGKLARGVTGNREKELASGVRADPSLPSLWSLFLLYEYLLDPLFLLFHAKNEERRRRRRREIGREGGANFRERSRNNGPVERIGST